MVKVHKWVDQKKIGVVINMFSPFSPAKSPNLAEICNPITHQVIELESYPNHPRILQAL